jgi:hypothetical protein
MSVVTSDIQPAAGLASSSASWELMQMAARGIPIPRRELRLAIRRSRSLMDSVLEAGDPADADQMGVARFRCTVIFGALGRLWGMEPHEVEELWTSGLLDCALSDEFAPRGGLGLASPD